MCVAGLPMAPALERGISGVSNKTFCLSVCPDLNGYRAPKNGLVRTVSSICFTICLMCNGYTGQMCTEAHNPENRVS